MATDNLELINGGWYASMHVPPDVREVLGKRRLRKTLTTGDKRVALHRVRIVVAEWWAEIHAARKSLRRDLDPVTREALRWRQELQKPEEEVLQDGSPAGTVGLVFHDRVEQIAEKHGPAKASEFSMIAQGLKTRIAPLIDDWETYSAKTVKAKTLKMYVSDVRRLDQKLKFLEDLTKRNVRDWLWALSTADELSEKTQGRILTALSSFWRWCHAKNYIPEDTLNPFVGVPLQKGVKSVTRAPFTAEQVVSLWAAAHERKNQPLADLIFVGAYTGARIEELGQITVKDVAPDFTFFKVPDAKTIAGIREVPIHRSLKTTMKRLVKASSDGYLIPSTAKNSLGQRAAPLGKVFGRLKEELGYGPEHVFHSIRKTVATLLENGGIAEGVAADIIGHEKTTMTYGLYSGGTSMANKVKAIQCLAYPFPAK